MCYLSQQTISTNKIQSFRSLMFQVERLTEFIAVDAVITASGHKVLAQAHIKLRCFVLPRAADNKPVQIVCGCLTTIHLRDSGDDQRQQRSLHLHAQNLPVRDDQMMTCWTRARWIQSWLSHLIRIGAVSTLHRWIINRNQSSTTYFWSLFMLRTHILNAWQALNRQF